MVFIYRQKSTVNVLFTTVFERDNLGKMDIKLIFIFIS